jgi:hypothetical protein
MTTTAQRRQDSYGPDQAPYAAACMRGAVRGELYPITVATGSKTFVVPAEWKGAFVRIQAEGGDVFYAISFDATLAVVDKAALATVAGDPAVLTPAVNGAGRIAKDQWQDIPFPPNATTFALAGSVAGVARCHLAES